MSWHTHYNTRLQLNALCAQDEASPATLKVIISYVTGDASLQASLGCYIDNKHISLIHC